MTRPNTTNKPIRTLSLEEEEEYLQATFHPNIKWKIV